MFHESHNTTFEPTLKHTIMYIPTADFFSNQTFFHQTIPFDTNLPKRVLLTKLYNEGKIDINEYILLIWDILPTNPWYALPGFVTTTTESRPTPNWLIQPTTISYGTGANTLTSSANNLI